MKKKQQEWKGYLNPSLSTADKKRIKEALPDSQFLLDWLAEMVEWGTRISFALKGKEETLCLTMTFSRPNHRLSGYSISSWGVEPLQCLAIMHFYWSSGKYGFELEGLPTEEDEDWW